MQRSKTSKQSAIYHHHRWKQHWHQQKGNVYSLTPTTPKRGHLPREKQSCPFFSLPKTQKWETTQLTNQRANITRNIQTSNKIKEKKKGDQTTQKENQKPGS